MQEAPQFMPGDPVRDKQAHDEIGRGIHVTFPPSKPNTAPAPAAKRCVHAIRRAFTCSGGSGKSQQTNVKLHRGYDGRNIKTLRFPLLFHFLHILRRCCRSKNFVTS